MAGGDVRHSDVPSGRRVRRWGSGIVAFVLALAVASYAFARIEFPGRKLWFTLMIATLLLPGRADAAPPPVQDFFDNAEFGGAQLSPSGRHLAAKVSAADGGRGGRWKGA